jgi:5'-nucleotidase
MNQPSPTHPSQVHIPRSGDKPILLLDMDGPLADFDLAFYRLITKLDFEVDLHSLKDPRRKRFMTENMRYKDEAEWARNHVNTSRWFLDLPVTAGALEGVPELEKHFDVWVCTKPLEVNRHCRDDKAAWLRGYFPQLEHKLIIAPTKSMVHGDILLDDAPKNDCAEIATWTAVLFPDTFNIQPGCGWEYLPRWTWGDPVEKLLAEVK